MSAADLNNEELDDSQIEQQPLSDVLGMSDEDFLNQEPQLQAAAPVAAAKEEEDPVKPVAAEPAKQPAKAEDKIEDPDAVAAQPDKAEGDAAGDKPGEKDPDYKGFYAKLTASFKANGKEMRVDNPDDAIRLMQMGANYNRKMAAMKPSLKVLKLLESNGLMDESKLGFLIDIEKKNPEAIAKLIKDSGINPLEIDVEKDSTYKPTVRKVDDRELEMDAVLDELRPSTHYSKLLDVVTTKWDADSQKVAAQNPQVLKVIESHMASGVFDLITAALEHDKSLGKFVGSSDLEAYKLKGDAIEAKGGFNHLFPSEQPPVTPQPPAKPPAAVKNDQRRDQRRAASPTKSTVAPDSGGKGDEFNPLAMSDEAFSKAIASKFL